MDTQDRELIHDVCKFAEECSPTPKVLSKWGVNYSALEIDEGQFAITDHDNTDHLLVIIDDLCGAVRNGASVSEFLDLLKKIDDYEKSHGHSSEPGTHKICVHSKQEDIDLNMLGTDGFNVLHEACGSGNI